jgi:cytochrome c oxidase assembly factor CtaG
VTSPRSLTTWFRSSLRGHVAAGMLLFGIPVYLILLGLHLGDGGSVTLSQFLKGLAGALISGLLFGVLFWFTATKWIRETYKNRQ